MGIRPLKPADAFDAIAWPVELHLFPAEAKVLKLLVGHARVRGLAPRTELAQLPLRADQRHAIHEQVRLHAHTQQPLKRSRPVSCACTTEKTRWPVVARRNAISAVARSAISPSITMSGSCRKIARSASSKLSLCGELHLAGAIEDEFDRVFHGDCAERRLHDRAQCRSHRGAPAASLQSREDHQTLRKRERLFEHLQ